MKLEKVQIFLIIVFMCCSINTYGQPEEYEAVKYSLIYEVVGIEYDFVEGESLGNKKIIYADVVFERIATINDKQAVIKPVSKIKKKRKIKDKNKEADYVENQDDTMGQYYLVFLKDLEKNVVEYTPKSGKLRIGIANIPVKLYLPQGGRPLDFSAGNISLGPTLGYSHQISETKSNLWINYLFSINFTMVTPNLDDFTKDTFNGNTLSALSPALGVTLNSNGVEVGIFAGKDYLPGEAAQFWKLNGKTWFAVSIGTSFSALQGK